MKLKDIPQEASFRELSEQLPLKWHKSTNQKGRKILCLCDEEVSLHGVPVILHHSVWLDEETEVVALNF